MTKRHWFVEIDERWENGCFIKTSIAKPVEHQEAHVMLEVMELKELARAQQKLLQSYRDKANVIDASGSLLSRSIWGDDDE